MGLRSWLQRLGAPMPSCAKCGHLCSEHPPTSDFGEECDECLYEISHGVWPEDATICTLHRPTGPTDVAAG